MRSPLILSLFAVAALTASAAAHEQGELRRTLSVTGQGQATSPPDMATVNTGVLTQAVTANAALAENSSAMKQIMDVLKKHRIADKDIQTSNFSVSPEYKRDPRGRRENEIVGYRVSNQVMVRVRNLPQLGEVLDALVQAGSNQLSGISFGIDDPTGVLNQARNRAIQDARSRAELYAQAAGVEVGKVISISEQSAPMPRPQVYARAFAEQASAVPVATGEQELHASIHMVFELVGN